MKKIVGLAALLLSLTAGSIFGYGITIDNWTEYTYEATIIYAGPGYCSRETVLVPVVGPGGHHPGRFEKGTGLCCTKKVIITRTSDGRKKEFVPRATGFGIACKGWALDIIGAQGNDFILQRK